MIFAKKRAIFYAGIHNCTLNTIFLREEHIEVRVKAASLRVSVYVAVPAIVHHKQIVQRTTAKHGHVQAILERERGVDQRLAVLDIDRIAGTSGRERFPNRRNEWIDFPNTSAIVATSLESTTKALIHRNSQMARVEDGFAILYHITGSNGASTQAFGNVMFGNMVVLGHTHMIFVCTVYHVCFWYETFVVAFLSVAFNFGFHAPAAVLVTLSNKTVVTLDVAFAAAFGVVAAIKDIRKPQNRDDGEEQKEEDDYYKKNDLERGSVLHVSVMPCQAFFDTLTYIPGVRYSHTALSGAALSRSESSIHDFVFLLWKKIYDTTFFFLFRAMQQKTGKSRGFSWRSRSRYYLFLCTILIHHCLINKIFGKHTKE